MRSGDPVVACGPEGGSGPISHTAGATEAARLELVEELADVLAFNAALRERFQHRAVRLRELLRSGHLRQVEYGGEMTRLIRTLRMTNDDLAARYDAFPPLGSAGTGLG